MQASEIKALIEAAIPGAVAEVSGDGDHFEARVRAAAFAGKSRVQQHQMVYAALGGHMQSDIHALALQTEVAD